MKEWLIKLIIVALIVVGGFFGYQRIMAQRTADADPTLETALVQRGDLAMTVEATGSLAPRSATALAFSSGGQVVEVLVIEGQEVAAGAALARLDTADLERQLATVEQTLLIQTASLAQLLDPDASRVAAAEANLAAAYMAYRGQDQEYTIDLEAAEQRLDDEIAAVEDAHTARDVVAGSDAAAEAQRALESAAIKAAAARAGYNIVAAGVISDTQALPAWAKLADAERALRDLVDPDAQTLEIARAQVEQARITVEQFRAQLDAATLAAPIAGTVTALHVQPGEWAVLGKPVIVLNDLSSLEVKINLDETDVARIEVGYPVVITLDAFPGVELSGCVESIAPVAIVQSGVVLYPVTINLDEMADLPLRSGMTANVSILVESREATLLVPLRAIETEGEQAYIWRVTPEGSERVEITLGLLTGTEAEILSGLAAWDEVVVYAGPEDRSNVELEGLRSIFGGE